MSQNNWDGLERRVSIDAQDVMKQIHEEITKLTEVNTQAKEEILAVMQQHLNADDHRFVQMLRKREARRQELWDKVKGSFIFWLLVSSTATIGLAVWEYAKTHLR